jgi:hypothetical protein
MRRRTRGTWTALTAGMLAIVVAGVLAIVHYAGQSPATPAAAASRARSAAASRAGAVDAAAPGTAAGSPATSPAASGRPRAAAPGSTAPGSTASGRPGTPSAPVAAGAAPAYFRTLPPGAALPSGAQCAAWVRARPMAENKAANARDNQVTGQSVGARFFSAGDSPLADELLAPRIDGDFTGTTAEILRWAACKWGIDQNVVFAQAAVESWWQQGTLGDWAADASACPPGHQPGQDGKSGQCPQSYGILQNRYPFEQASWPAIGDSTAMNADTAYAIWRSCYDGYETWLNTVPHNGTYAAGDLWGCVGRWFSGRWHDTGAQQYIARVQQYLSEEIWTTPDFQQG